MQAATAEYVMSRKQTDSNWLNSQTHRDTLGLTDTQTYRHTATG